jgi:hypothetical protein
MLGPYNYKENNNYLMSPRFNRYKKLKRTTTHKIIKNELLKCSLPTSFVKEIKIDDIQSFCFILSVKNQLLREFPNLENLLDLLETIVVVYQPDLALQNIQINYGTMMELISHAQQIFKTGLISTSVSLQFIMSVSGAGYKLCSIWPLLPMYTLSNILRISLMYRGPKIFSDNMFVMSIADFIKNTEDCRIFNVIEFFNSTYAKQNEHSNLEHITNMALSMFYDLIWEDSDGFICKCCSDNYKFALKKIKQDAFIHTQYINDYIVELTHSILPLNIHLKTTLIKTEN